MKIKRVIYLLMICVVLNVTICVIIYNTLEATGKVHVGQAVRWFYEEYVYPEQPCFTEHDSGITVISNLVDHGTQQYYDNKFQCLPRDQSLWKHRTTDINIEEELDALKISYPKYVFPVSGYLQLVTVDSWKVKRLKVIIVPHSHQDPGWKSTFRRYFIDFGKKTLDNMITMLLMNRETKFIWSEIVILSAWWKQASQEGRAKFKMLVQNGQIEITTGGWVMTDEGTTHYTAMIDQLIEGHQWLKHNLDIEPSTGWSVDPFGHSPTMAYLLKQSDIKYMVIQRVHYGLKQHLAKQKNFEFQWRQGWASDDSTDIFCHMMPFLSYAIQHSCGPDPHICCQYDFYGRQCYYGNKKISAVPVDNNNIHQVGRQLWEQFQKKAELYRTGVILVPHGDDFRYSSPSEWYKQMNNLEKLMKYINSRPYMQTQVKFGTLSDYFDEVDKTVTTFPTMSGDFFTYADRGEDYWSGYYTTRPHYKHIIRRVQDLLRSFEILFSYSLAAAISKEDQLIIEFLRVHVDDLNYMRQQVALFQHHDAITGTSRHQVMVDYAKRLHSGYKRTATMVEKVMSYMIQTTDGISSTEDIYDTITVNSNWTKHEELITQKIIDISKPKQILLYNSLNSIRHSVVKIHINQPSVMVISTITNTKVHHQISPVIENAVVKENIFELSYRVRLPGLSVSRYLISPSTNDSSNHFMADVKIVVDQNKNLRFEKFTTDYYNLPKFSISNEVLTATFYTCNGKLQYITKDSSTKYRLEVKLMTYGTGSWSNPFKDKSGAYLFLPDGNAKPFHEDIRHIYVVNGSIYSTVVVTYTSITQVYTLYKTKGSDGMGIHIENIVNISNGSLWDNKELMMRIVTDVKDKDNHLCVDLNGFQMHRKKTRKKFPIQGNFYPMTSMAFIETDINRVTLISSETHGVASLSPGWLEVVLDRRLIQDDWRGLSQGVKDNVLTRSQFVILFERKHPPQKKEKTYLCYPSPTAKIITSQLESHVISMTLSISSPDWSTLNLSPATQWDIDILNIRFLRMDEKCFQLLLIVHATQLDCSFPVSEHDSNFQQSNNHIRISKIFKDNNLTAIEQTTLTGTKVIEALPVDADIKVNAMEIKTFKLTVC